MSEPVPLRFLGVRCLECASNDEDFQAPNFLAFWDHLEERHEDMIIQEYGQWITEPLTRKSGSTT
jgi:hypothetical protein